jgi:hypothetical protein
VTWEVPGVERPQFPVENAHNDALFVKLIEDFLAAVETGRAPVIDGESVAVTTELIHDIYAKSGAPLKLL